MLKKLFPILSLSLLFAFVTFGQDVATDDPAAKPASTTQRSPIFKPTKDQILEVQKILNQKKLYDGEATGVYNTETRTGIKSFQNANGLKDTGTLNRATLEKFGVELTDKQKLIPVSPNSYVSASGNKTPKTGAKADSSSTDTKDGAPKKVIFKANPDQIKSAQKLLKVRKMYDGEETGKFDDAFRLGLKKFQVANGVKVTGTLNAATLEKMGIPLTDKQKANAATSAAE